MSDDDQHKLNQLAGHLGIVCGVLGRPSVRAGLVALLLAPQGVFSLSAVLRAHHLLGQVIATVEAGHARDNDKEPS